jgi:hypothetical protein
VFDKKFFAAIMCSDHGKIAGSEDRSFSNVLWIEWLIQKLHG